MGAYLDVSARPVLAAADAAALRAGLETQYRTGQQAILTSAGASFRRSYVWDASAPDVDDGVNVIKPDSIAGGSPGRFLILGDTAASANTYALRDVNGALAATALAVTDLFAASLNAPEPGPGALAIGDGPSTNQVVIGQPGVLTNVLGDFAVQGTNFEVNSTTVHVADRLIVTNYASDPNAPVPTMPAGLNVHRGAVGGVPRDHASWVWDEAQQKWFAVWNIGGDEGTFTGFLPIGCSELTAADGVVVGTYVDTLGADLSLRRGAQEIASLKTTGVHSTGSFFGTGINHASGGTLNIGNASTAAVTVHQPTTFSLQVFIPNGSAAAPAIALSSATSTGFFRPATNEIGVSANGTQVVSFSSSGARFLAGSAAAPAMHFVTDIDTGVFSGGSGILGFSIDGSERARITSAVLMLTGIAIAIGNTATASAGSIRAQNNVTVLAARNAANNGDIGLVATSSNTVVLGTSANTGIIYDAGSAQPHTFRQGGAAALTLTDASLTLAGSRVLFIPDGTSALPSASFTADTDTGAYRPADDTYAIATGGSERARFTATGLGIGGVTPTVRLHVHGTDGNQNALTLLRMHRATSHVGFGAAGIAAQAVMSTVNSTGGSIDAATFRGGLLTATAGSEVGAYFIGTYSSGAIADRVRVTGAGMQIGAVGGSTGALLHLLQVAATSGTSVGLLLKAAAHNPLAQATENHDVDFDLARTVTWTNGGGPIATQRFVRIRQPTIEFTAGSPTNVNDAATLAVDGAPLQGANAGLVRKYAIWAVSGLTRLGGGVRADGAIYSPIVSQAFTATPNFDWALTCHHKLGILTANVTNATASNVPDGGLVTVEMQQDATGGRTVAWDSVYRFAGTDDQPDPARDVRTVWTFRSDGTKLWCVAVAKGLPET